MRISEFSIKTKLTLISLTASVVVLAAFGAGIFFYESHTAFYDKENLILRQSQVVANNLTAALSFQDQTTINEALSVFKTDPDFIAVQVFSDKGEILYAFPESFNSSFDNSSKNDAFDIIREKSYFDIKTEVTLDKKPIGLIQLRSSYASVRTKIERFAMALMLSLITSVILAMIISFRLQGIITKPLLGLLNLIRNISASRDYSLSISNLGNDEIGVLGKSFNLMLSEINQRDISLRLSNLSLEERVQERTRELEDAVLQLNNAREAITIKHKQLQDVIAEAPIAMAMLDLNLKFLVSSLKWKSDYDLKSQDFSIATLDMRSKKFPLTWESACKHALNGEIISNSEDSFYKLDGSKTYLRWTIQPWYKEDRKVGGVIVSSENISDLVNARDDALKLSQTKSEFLANISHELRTPLNGIIGFANMLKETNCTDEQRESVDLIRSSGDILSRVINDVLDFSKIERGATEIENLSFSPRELLTNLVKRFTMSERVKNSNLQIELNIDPATPKTLIGDAFRLEQVLSNLLGNATKFTTKGFVKLTLNVTSLLVDRSSLHFSVQDTGIGIEKDKLQLIFKPFSQADGTVTRRFGGTGLGLAIASELVSLMGGRLEARSTLGQGSEFFFDLTLQNDTHECPSQETSVLEKLPLIANHSKRILVAEDNIINQKLVSKILEKAGYQILLVENGALAVEAFKQSKFDLIILDLQMPIMGGLEAATRIREYVDLGGDNIPIVALTAHAFEEDRLRCESVGMDNFLTKPIDRNLLLSTIANLCNLNIQ